MNVLFLCTGNSCRSQMAHGVLQSLDKGLKVHSAGTRPSLQVNQRAVEVMKEIDIDISLHTPKNVDIYLNDSWDYVISVCDSAKESCPAFIGKVGKHLHIGFDDPSNVQGSEEHVMGEFRRVRDEIRKQIAEFYVTENLK